MNDTHSESGRHPLVWLVVGLEFIVASLLGIFAVVSLGSYAVQAGGHGAEVILVGFFVFGPSAIVLGASAEALRRGSKTAIRLHLALAVLVAATAVFAWAIDW